MSYTIRVYAPNGQCLMNENHNFSSADKAESFAQKCAAAFEYTYGNCDWQAYAN